MPTAACALDSGVRSGDRSGDSRRDVPDEVRPDFIDIITPPDTHVQMRRLAGERGVHVLCQKPLAPTLADAVALVDDAERAGIRLRTQWTQEKRPSIRQTTYLRTVI